MYSTDETIAAIASAPGGAARGIIRLSGPRVVEILEGCFHPQPSDSLRAVATATVLEGTIALPDSPLRSSIADVYFWPTQRSYTRQPAAEIHLAGSPPLLSAALRAVCACGARLAEPGEFTLRAFLAGRLDLTQAEAVLGVIDVRDARQLEHALAQLAGGVGQPLHALRDELLNLLAHLEAGLDFVEDNIQFISPGEIAETLSRGGDLIDRICRQLAERAQDDTLPRVVLRGWPNVGKSSLFNALAGEGAALVADQPGTTRDYLAATLDLSGIRCQLIDTAGVEPDSPRLSISQAAQQLSDDQAKTCDVRILCLDATRPLNDWERAALAANQQVPGIVLWTKCDDGNFAMAGSPGIPTSAHRGLGLATVRERLRHALAEMQTGADAATITAQRCAESLRAARQSLAWATTLNAERGGEELIAAEVRAALDVLGSVVGAVYTEDLLDRIFSRFCIGK